jgi:hypothetical protein
LETLEFRERESEREREMDFGVIFGSGVLIDELAFRLL